MKPKIQGIPCQIEILSYSAPDRTPVTCTTINPPDPGDVEWRVLDMNGEPWPLLQEKLTRRDINRIDDEVSERVADEHAEAAISAAEYRMEYHR